MTFQDGEELWVKIQQYSVSEHKYEKNEAS